LRGQGASTKNTISGLAFAKEMDSKSQEAKKENKRIKGIRDKQ